jgi:hypothetical protein
VLLADGHEKRQRQKDLGQKHKKNSTQEPAEECRFFAQDLFASKRATPQARRSRAKT